MAKSFSIPLFRVDAGDNNAIKLDTGRTVTLRESPFSATLYTLTETGVGTGIYKNDAVAQKTVKLYVDGVEKTDYGTFNTYGDLNLVLLLAGGTMTGAIAMGNNKITGAAAATANGDLTRWEQVGVLDQLRTITGQWIFETHPSASPGTLAVTNSGQYTTKKYVDDLFGGAVGVVQSAYKIKLIPGRAIEDSYSKTTAELANAYLAAKTDITTRTGDIVVEPLGTALNTINLDDGVSQWISAGVFYVGEGNKPILNRRAPNSSLTVAGGIRNCRIKDGAAGAPVVSARSYTNFTFIDCEFDVPDATDISFTTCKFLGINKLKSVAGNDITLTNCTGDMFWYNDTVGATVTVTGTQPADIREVTAANFNW